MTVDQGGRNVQSLNETTDQKAPDIQFIQWLDKNGCSEALRRPNHTANGGIHPPTNQLQGQNIHRLDKTDVQKDLRRPNYPTAG